MNHDEWDVDLWELEEALDQDGAEIHQESEAVLDQDGPEVYQRGLTIGAVFEEAGDRAFAARHEAQRRERIWQIQEAVGNSPLVVVKPDGMKVVIV